MPKEEFTSFLHPFVDPPSVPPPSTFDYPHQYEANPWAVQAASSLQSKIPRAFNHDFNAVGKMFGVLVVDTSDGPRFLAGFSGKIGDATQIHGFVPPIFDTLIWDGLFKKGEAALNTLTQRIHNKEIDTLYLELQQKKKRVIDQQTAEILALKSGIQKHKSERALIRKNQRLSPQDLKSLAMQSMEEQRKLKTLKRTFSNAIASIESALQKYVSEINHLKWMRATQSTMLQNELFEHYILHNFQKEKDNVLSLFEKVYQQIPPAGTGECALPKLLHFAATHGLKPICFAEFWWGASPVGEVRKHGHFYPACRAKCEPLLDFLLRGIPKKVNPILETIIKTPLSIVFEDDQILVIDKPSGLLSVPGRTALDSAEDRLKLMMPNERFIKAAHRLDMGTSGLMVFAKNDIALSRLQIQFEKQKVKKTYTALLAGTLAVRDGEISLPLRLNLDHRPHQMVCFDHGKKALTHYKVLSVSEQQTRINFFPKTGRTHQLRVHSAHPLGLNCSIVGDELYGTKKDRLYLHASQLTFQHPASGALMNFTSEVPF